MQAKLLLALLLSAIARPLWAGDLPLVPSVSQISQFTQEERNWLRERWRLASPEERQALWRQYREILQQASPEHPPWGGLPSPADLAGATSNFGAGFDARRPTPSDPGEDAPTNRGWFGR